MIVSLQAVTSSSASDALLPLYMKHNNRLPFTGVLSTLDEPSDKSPSGAQGHRVILTREAAKKSIDSLLGMAIDYSANWNTHDSIKKFGIITMAQITKNSIEVGGFIYVRDFPDIEEKMRQMELGMSYEISDAHVVDMRAEVWTLSRIGQFTGAAVLLREKAAYRKTRFELA